MTFFGIMCLIFGAATIAASVFEWGSVAAIIQTVGVVGVFVYIMVINNRSARIYW